MNCADCNKPMSPRCVTVCGLCARKRLMAEIAKQRAPKVGAVAVDLRAHYRRKPGAGFTRRYRS